MNFTGTRTLAAMAVLYVSLTALALAGAPIKGVIVKGGRNPQGDLHNLSTTDASGKFTVEFADGGEYRLQFEGPSGQDLGDVAQAGAHLDYTVSAKDQDDASARKKSTGDYGLATKFSVEVGRKAQIVVTVPQGGGQISGVLQSADTPTAGKSNTTE